MRVPAFPCESGLTLPCYEEITSDGLPIKFTSGLPPFHFLMHRRAEHWTEGLDSRRGQSSLHHDYRPPPLRSFRA